MQAPHHYPHDSAGRRSLALPILPDLWPILSTANRETHTLLTVSDLSFITWRHAIARNEFFSSRFISLMTISRRWYDRTCDDERVFNWQRTLRTRGFDARYRLCFDWRVQDTRRQRGLAPQTCAA
jgi:hypothetical protein